MVQSNQPSKPETAGASRSEEEQYLGAARAQVRNVDDHCHTARSRLVSIRQAVAGEDTDGAQSLQRAVAEEPDLRAVCRNIKVNTFDALYRQFSKLVAASEAERESVEEVADDESLTQQLVQDRLTELAQHHSRLMDEVENVLTAASDEPRNIEAAVDSIEQAVQAVDHIESTVGHLECILDRVAATQGETIDDTEWEESGDRSVTISGTVSQGGAPVAGVSVQAFDRDLRRSQSLGTATTAPDGTYDVSYRRSEYQRAERGTADVFLRVRNEVGTRLAQTETRFNVDTNATIDVDINPDIDISPTVYARLRSELVPLLDGRVVRRLTEDDVEFLTRELNLPERSAYPDGRAGLTNLVRAATLAGKTPFDEKLLYGILWARTDGVSRRSLATAEAETLVSDLRSAVEAGVVRLDTDGLTERLGDGIDRLSRAIEIETKTEARATVRFETPEGEPLVDYGVRVSDPDDDRKQRRFETDSAGEFTVSFMHAPDATPSRTVRISVYNDAGATVHDETTTVTDDSPTVLTVSDRAPGLSGSRSLESLRSAGGVDVPATGMSNTNLSALRRASAVTPASSSDSVDALATFDLTTTPATGSALSARGYRNQVDIATTPPRQFQTTMQGPLSPDESLLVHAKASAQTHLMDSMLVERLTAQRAGRGRAAGTTGDTDDE